ncbi:MAG: DUF177 domain-containing protein, partial [Bacteroidaceae bacterium]|nr:DUF177 domain-containing protein [Bacteroidaceae bacterium]
GGEIETTVKVSRKNGCFEVVFSSRGSVVVECSRCLDPISLPIDTTDKLYVKLGDDYLDEGDELVIIPEDSPKLDVAWHIYEFIALAVPPQHSHPEGECNQEMMAMLRQENPDSSDAEEEGSETDEADPRWAALKNLNIKN